MKEDTVITLENGKKYLLLLEDNTLNGDYFLSVLLDDKGEPTDKYLVLKQIRKDGQIYTKKEDDVVILNQLLEDYRRQYEEDYSEEE